MSFGDFSKSGRPPKRTNITPTQPTITEEDESNSGAFAQISDGILQYQVRRSDTHIKTCSRHSLSSLVFSPLFPFRETLAFWNGLPDK